MREVEWSRVKLTENWLILNQICSTLGLSIVKHFTPICFQSIKTINLHTSKKKKKKEVKNTLGFLLMETTSPTRDFFQNVQLSFFLTILLTVLHNNGLSYFFGSAKKNIRDWELRRSGIERGRAAKKRESHTKISWLM